ncbi:SDR family NAD(P)-dependent oxidoreductase [Stutzerimonas azotifigens]|uniref:SDR family NAD(P)-dependent oxidoreductase n=1 Tax=Stutzerimonas azotifigens TaxID=291995 RepID=UPI0003FF574B|nr:SDR family oxidoreductase [Stutzerimonas azotifigens]
MQAANNRGTALITGASSGIGAVYADRLAARGHDLILVARDRARLEALAGRLEGAHEVHVEVLVADLTDPQALDALAERLRGDAIIDLLVNNAGMAMQGRLAEADPAALLRMLALNVTATTRLAQAAAANFSAAGRGAIVNLGSVVALAPGLFNVAYTATKGYVLSLSEALQAELAPAGVRVQAVLPGVTRTQIWERSSGSLEHLPAQMVMEAEKMVDAALRGFDLGETVTLPSLPDAADWERLLTARAALGPNLSRNQPAPRYRAGA